jgi:hypothetical protein
MEEEGKSLEEMIALNTKAFVDVRMSRSGSTTRRDSRRVTCPAAELTNRCLLMWTSDLPRKHVHVCTAHKKLT